jgi:hypothetical protein
MADKFEEIIIPTWPHKYAPPSKEIIDKSGLGFHEIQEIRNTSMKPFNEFKGQCLNTIIDIENCIDVITLNLLAPNNNKQKRDILFCFYKKQGGISFVTKFENFKYLIEQRFQPYNDIKKTIDQLHSQLKQIISFRNILAHAFIIERIIDLNGEIKHDFESYWSVDRSIIKYDNLFRQQVTEQLSALTTYLQYIHETILNTDKIEERFYFSIGYYSPKYFIDKRRPAPHDYEFEENRTEYEKMFGVDFGVNRYLDKNGGSRSKS